MKKINFGIRSWLLLAFIVVFTISFYFVDRYFVSQQDIIKRALEDIDVSSVIHENDGSQLVDKDEIIKMNDSIVKTKEEIDGILLILRIGWIAWLIIISIIALIIFIILVRIFSRPLIELQKATESIKIGDYNIQLKERGFKEFRELIQSFNLMSEELSNIQEKLLESERQIIWKDLSNALSEDIKKPVENIEIELQKLTELAHDEEKFIENFPNHIADIKEKVNRLQKTLRNFSILSGEVKPKVEKINPQEFIDNTIAENFQDSEISVDYKCNDLIYFDKTHFRFIITNLIANAIEASCGHNTINISVKREKYLVVFAIEDHGCGINNENIKRIFNPFYTTKKNKRGFGLAIVKKFIDINYGAIYVSSAIGKGTKILFSTQAAQ